MDIRFAANNTHLENALTFAERDPHLRRLYQEKYIYHSPLIQEFPRDEPGILTLGGGRQVGKSTLLKQWMQDLLVTGVPPHAICFYSGELIGDNQSLFYLLQSQLKEMPSDSMKYLIIDEITDIQYWEKGIKYLADIGFFENTVVMLSGSDLVLMQDARKGFPGRRGKASKVDFHYYPLSFREFIGMKDSLPIMDSEEKIYSDSHMKLLYEEFHNYLIHGGFLTAINDFANHQSISPATLMVYSDWIRGDFAKRNKNEIFLREIMGSIHKHYLKQVSWDNLAKELSINHVQTISDYASLLQSMDALFVQAAIMEDKGLYFINNKHTDPHKMPQI